MIDVTAGFMCIFFGMGLWLAAFLIGGAAAHGPCGSCGQCRCHKDCDYF